MHGAGQTELNQPHFEATACEICGSQARTLVATRADLFLGGTQHYTMYECHGCGAIYQHPRPTRQSIRSFYPDEYPQYTAELATEHWLKRLDRRYGLRKRCRVVTRHVPHGRLLDVGCATGDFLSEMKLQPGWSVVGVEPNPSAAARAQRATGVPVISAVLNEAPFADASFDAITMWDVLEHVHDPLVILDTVARLLRPGGVFVVNHPNTASIDRRVFGRYWLGYELPRHLYLYPGELLRRLMEERGFIEVERRCVYGSYAASSTSLVLMSVDHLGQNRITNLIRTIVYSKLLRLLFLPYFKIIDSQGLGSNITAVFRRVA